MLFCLLLGAGLLELSGKCPTTLAGIALNREHWDKRFLEKPLSIWLLASIPCKLACFPVGIAPLKLVVQEAQHRLNLWKKSESTIQDAKLPGKLSPIGRGKKWLVCDSFEFGV